VLRERAEILRQAEEPPAPGIEMLLAVLEQLSLVADADQVPDSTEGVVTLMTLHTAKGLEFPVVFLTGWEEGLFPHQRALTDDAELAEERRLAYVGITRARQRLYISRAAMRLLWGQPSANPPSRFLAEIPQHVLDWRRLVETQRDDWGRSAPTTASRFGDRPRFGESGGESAGRSGGAAGRFGESAQSRIAATGMRTTNFKGWQNRPALVLAVGDRVNHDKYGLGKVVAAEGSGVRATVTVDFGAAGTVRLMLVGGVPMTKL
jgi:DNA helicase-2/ATP-dependent DNA helicase PcrA